MTHLNDVAESKASFQLALMGYRIIGGDVWITTHEEPETGWEGRKVGAWRGSRADLYEALQAHGFPDSESIICPTCKTNEVEFIGGDCYFCASIVRDELRGESILSEQRGKR